ncbi:lipopolysaccharide biosynthesis protein [Salinibacterium hongtaonis]|uniref:Polysaccharide biosynthesis protein n=1 Tax=Homoserinimonas hongtaonis TaxID=2079791 RepID=A0A2U1SWP5_9MICO|nr:hypothetical protein [Salinibacterium hongtaonis]PWB96057.1 hypothetical protein DF220_11740 [Salinibacterium hongtaonis]
MTDKGHDVGVDTDLSGPGRRRFVQVGIASVVVGIAGYIVLLLAAPTLGPEEYALFAVFWSLLYFITGTIFGVQQEITRSVRSAQSDMGNRLSGAKVAQVAFVACGAVAVVVAASSLLWAPALFGSEWENIATCVIVGTVLYSGFALLAGALSGTNSWGRYSFLITSDAVVRLALFVIVLASGASFVGLAIATVAAFAVWIPAILFSRRCRSAMSARGDAPLRRAVLRTGSSVLATASTAALVTGFPAMIKAVVADAPTAELGVVILVITLTRAPILMPITAYLGIAVTTFLEQRHRGIRVLFKPALGLAALGGVGVALSAAIGPWLIVTMFGEEFYADPWLLALSTLAATLIGLLSLTGAAALAFSQHRLYVLGWAASAITAFGLLFIEIGLSERVLLAMLLAPLPGLLIHIWALVQTPLSPNPDKN